MLRWLADLSARRLLNRIHYVLYDGINAHSGRQNAPGDSPEAGRDPQVSLQGISQELNHQLHAWFDLLPQSIQPDLDNPNASVDDAIAVMRYHAAGDIIFRPFLHQICAMPPGESAPDPVLENAKRCLYHCRGYLSAVEYALQYPTASLEIFLHS